MRVWLIGASRAGIEALRQLEKNDGIEIVVSDPSPRPRAVQEGVIAKVDHVESVTALNINTLARRIRPDLILIDPGADDRGLGRVSGGQAMAQGLNDEIVAISDYPCLVL
jgi:hypothetical protein